MDQTQDRIKDFILRCLEEKKAENISCLSLVGTVPIADYMIFATGRSIKNIQAIAEHVALELKHKFKWSSNIDGLHSTNWVVLDAGDVIVHLFDHEARERFKVEELWKGK